MAISSISSGTVPQNFEGMANATTGSRNSSEQACAASACTTPPPDGTPAARGKNLPPVPASIALQLMQPPAGRHGGIDPPASAYGAPERAFTGDSDPQLGDRFVNWLAGRGFKTNADANAYETFMRTGKELFGDEFIRQAIRAGDLPGGPGDLAIGLVGGGKSGHQAIRAADDAAHLVERTLLGSVRKIGPLRELEVGMYGELVSIRRTLGAEGAYHIDHIPSKAALRIAKEAELGTKLSKAEIQQIDNEGIGVVMSRDMHRDSRTYAGRNHALKIIMRPTCTKRYARI